MFIELQLDEEGSMIGVNMNQIQTIVKSKRIIGHTRLEFYGEERGLEVFESYKSVMAKVRIRQ